MRTSPYNLQAAAYLKAAREASGRSQEVLAMELSERLGFSLSSSSLAYYETAGNAIPAAVVFAVLELTRKPIRRPRRAQ
jgi:hypothetical protein